MPTNDIDRSSTWLHRSGAVVCAATHVRAVAARCGVQRTVDDVGDRACHRLPVDLDGHRHHIGGQPVDEVHRAVDGVDDPGRTTGGVVRAAAALLAEDTLAGAQFGQPVTQQPFGFGVDDGDGVGRGALGAHRRAGRFALRRTAEDLLAAAPHEVRRLGRQPLGDRAEFGRIERESFHRLIAAQIVANRLPSTPTKALRNY